MPEKTTLTRNALAIAFLDRLHQEPGMETVADVSIAEINDPAAASNWRASTLEKDRDDILRVTSVIERIQDELRELYALQPAEPPEG